ncbi:MAG: HpcH/HpaI aldolase/citrate lyase family protein [Bacteroidales bacterium]|nr:HpcH/HpaI aldolase/citrate lyase family protein [Bacteroidales bacterium]
MTRTMKKRRSMLYIPGNNPAMIQQGGVYGADSLLLDLEDSVALNQKDSARILVRNMIRSVDFYGTEVCVRVNHLSTPFGMNDLEEIVPLQPSAIRYPKTESAEEVGNLLEIIEKIEDKHGLPHHVMTIHAMIETAMGVQNVFEIASRFPRIDAITIGGQDLTADMNIIYTPDGAGIDFARKRIVMAAKASHIDIIDTVFPDVNDEEGLRRETEYAKKIGFTGKAVINPRQIDIIHQVFTPTEEEIRKAYRIVKEFRANASSGLGVFAIDGKMIDAPVVRRAEYILQLANIALPGEEAENNTINGK